MKTDKTTAIMEVVMMAVITVVTTVDSNNIISRSWIYFDRGIIAMAGWQLP
jgi:hypothetical protein